MRNINPTTTESWKKLVLHFQEIKGFHLNRLFQQNPTRQEDYTLSLNPLQFDYSKNKISDKTLKFLVEFAQEMGLPEAIEDFFGGRKINFTEDRAVLHPILRDFSDRGVKIANEAVYPLVKEARSKIKIVAERVISGQWKGHTGKPITDVVNIGIGGSDLGPQMLIEALTFYKNHLHTHFISNIDGDAVHHTLKNLSPETTLFIVVSKTFSTVETLTNATTCKNWLLKNLPNTAIKKHFVAVSSNTQAVEKFGINSKNIFPIWDWVGGRFSMWGSVGVSIALALGFEHFEQFLKGAHSVDEHFRKMPFKKNIPVLMGLLGVWYTNFFKVKAEAIIPYAESLHKLTVYLQQLCMESHGKSVDRNGRSVNYATGNVLFGSTGSNAQHSFMQLIHQGTQLIPVDFIGFKKSLYGDTMHHTILMKNYDAQRRALQEGKTKEAVHLSMKFEGNLEKIPQLLPYKIFEGDRVSNSFLFDVLNPFNMGMLIALYEHRVFVQGVLWNINSFDQFGVELGKEMAK